MSPSYTGPLLQGTSSLLCRFFELVLTHPCISFTANSVKGLVANLPHHLDGPILVDTTMSPSEWDRMIYEEDGLPCTVVWHDDNMFIVELPTGGRGAAVASFILTMFAIYQQFQQQSPAPQSLDNYLGARTSLLSYPPLQLQIMLKHLNLRLDSRTSLLSSTFYDTPVQFARNRISPSLCSTNQNNPRLSMEA